MPDEMLVEVNGEALLLDPAGAAWWPVERTLVLADIHFEKGSAYARGRQFLPPYDTRTALKRIAALMRAHSPARVIALGDSFHDRWGAGRLDDFEREQLAAMGRVAEWIWIEGNHDPEIPSWLGGRIASEVAVGGLVFRHEPSAVPVRGEVAGHLHPCATVTRRGHSIRRRCFVSDGTRLVLPAFGAYAGGLDVREQTIRSLFGQRVLAYLLGSRRVYAAAA